MNAKPNFLSRLDRAGERSLIESKGSISEVERSILTNLRNIFQIRQGNSMSAPRCGVPDFTELFAEHSDPSRKLCSSIKDVIEEFEPRLQSVVVKRVDSGRFGSLRFEITGRFNINNRASSFRVETVMSSMDRFTIESD
ncbi:MAG: type VI secretion system baseplate subunit TssE [Gammaproteobacteria bacterium]